MRKLLVFGLFVVLAAAGCKQQSQQTTSPNAKRYELRGKVVSVDKANKKATIDHEKVENYMEAMTMDFPIKDDFVFENLTPGSKIKADLVVDNGADPPFWLENITISAAPQPGDSPVPVKENVAVEGKPLPAFKLTDQDGKPFTPAEFKGKAWALTFIYSQCPLPDYCIAMSRRFSDIANKVAADETLKEKIRLLSISFDPTRDTPEKLREYGLGYLGQNSPDTDFNVWKLAVGSDGQIKSIADFFGLRYEVDANDKTQFTHSLRTAVIKPDGTVAKVYTGNEWTEDQLLSALEDAAK
ncbi:MAG: SCO family protein [Pyrinomonadaceae bacterium]